MSDPQFFCSRLLFLFLPFSLSGFLSPYFLFVAQFASLQYLSLNLSVFTLSVFSSSYSLLTLVFIFLFSFFLKSVFLIFRFQLLLIFVPILLIYLNVIFAHFAYIYILTHNVIPRYPTSIASPFYFIISYLLFRPCRFFRPLLSILPSIPLVIQQPSHLFHFGSLSSFTFSFTTLSFFLLPPSLRRPSSP